MATIGKAGRAPLGHKTSYPALNAREEIAAYHLADERRIVGGLIERAIYTASERRRAAEIARQLVAAARVNRQNYAGVDAFMREYGLSSEEGAILMCIAESLLRIPDAETADQLIAEKIAEGSWDKHVGHSESLFVNASTWGLMLTGRVVKLREARGHSPVSILKRVVARSGEPLIRQAVRHAVKILGDQFVLGRDIGEAISRASAQEAKGYRYSYDMLGEAAQSQADAERYFARYMAAIDAIGTAAGAISQEHEDVLMGRPSLSIKLSALHPRFEAGKEERLKRELGPNLLELVRSARARGLSITIDAEEQDKLEPTLELMTQAMMHPSLQGWSGLGIAVQAYSKRAVAQLRWLLSLHEATGKRIHVRLVKGAYWDSEIKWAQEQGLSDYPVFTRKLHTDVSYLACMRFLLTHRQAFFPQFATHNAHTLAAAYAAAGGATYEFQRLHGMGEALYDEVIGEDRLNRQCRIYAPVGGHEDLLPYLVRRLLENGANTSFVNRLADDEAPVADIIRDPVEVAEREREEGSAASGKLLTRPREILQPERPIAGGLALDQSSVRSGLVTQIRAELEKPFSAGPIVDGDTKTAHGDARAVTCPHNRRQRLGTVWVVTDAQVDRALNVARENAYDWERTPALERARLLEAAAELFERDRARLMAIVVRETGKTLSGALGDVREAIDFLRYYAGEARRLFSGPVELKGPTGETNLLELRARGPFACIAPWNFPLAIFTGQVAAALAAGNPVLAKPAEQAPISAHAAVRLLHEAGIPQSVLHLLTGDGSIGAKLVADKRVKGVVFTGSNETAGLIRRSLLDRGDGFIPLIAETGGLNAMIADSSALPEQVVRDCIRSAFDNAGQRCSAARVLFVQNDIADRTTSMLTGAIEALDIGDPLDYANDIGPVIDESAQYMLEAYKLKMRREARELVDCVLPSDCRNGTFVSPAAYEIDRISVLERETFGPILHVVRYSAGHLDKVVRAINETGYGLTLGLHSRIGAVADYVSERANVGNLYVNRAQIAAQVGVQPFGGEGLSGSGPKAGGPHYLKGFATERVRSTDITATGGDLALLRAAAKSGEAEDRTD